VVVFVVVKPMLAATSIALSPGVLRQRGNAVSTSVVIVIIIIILIQFAVEAM
jgi:hypothetical protein